MKKRMMAVFTVLCLVCSLFPEVVSKADSPIYYYDGSSVVTLNSGYSVLESETVVTMSQSSFYVVRGNVTIQTLAVHAINAKLILCDGATLTVTQQSVLSESIRCTLNVYAGSSESSTINGTGKISCYYGLRVLTNQTLNVYGGVIESESTLTNNSGIGGICSIDNNNCGNINIYGGTITATGNSLGAGIGGADEGNGGSVSIYGGTVTATAGNYCDEGIGHGGRGTDPGTLTIGSGMVLVGSDDGTNWSVIPTSTRKRYMKAMPSATVSTAPVASTGLIANGSAHNLLTSGGTATNGTMKYAIGTDAMTAPTDGWNATIPTRADAGTYYVWYKAAGNGTQDSIPVCLTVTISGVASVTTIPTVSTGLKSKESPQNLLTNKGVAADGTMQFALGVNDTDAPTSGWSEDIPQGTEAKTYHVWYKAAGTGVYTDSAPVCLQVVISPADTTPVNPVTPPYTPPYTQPYTPPYTPSNPQPILPGGGSWSTISTVVETVPAGGSLNINMNGSITLPTTATDSIKGKDINLVLDMGNGIKWSINGKDIAGASGDVYLGVYLDASGIPVDVVNRLTGEREKMNFMLSRDGGLGFAATLTLPLKKTWAGHIANLFNYNKITKDMDFVSSGKIGADGSADLVIGSTKTPAKTAALKKQSIAETLKLAATDETNQASSYYTIVVDDHSLDPNTTPEPTPTAEPTTTPATSAAITLSASSQDGKINLSWNKLKKAKKYRVYQKVDGKNKLFKELKKTSLTIDKAYVNGKKKRKKLKIGKKYTFSIKAFVNGKWTKITKAYTKTIKVKK